MTLYRGNNVLVAIVAMMNVAIATVNVMRRLAINERRQLDSCCHNSSFDYGSFGTATII